MHGLMMGAVGVLAAMSVVAMASGEPPVGVRPIPATGPSAAPSAATQPIIQPFKPKLRSPEYLADHRVTVRLRAPKAETVICESVLGRFPMTRDEQGDWAVTLGPLEPDIYEYTFNVDGVKFNDPSNPTSKTPQVSFLPVSGDVPAPWEITNVPHGKVQYHWYQSKSLDVQRRVHVYTPPGYDPAAATLYPVLYLLHGSGDDDSGWVNIGKANLIFDNLLAAGKMKPMIVVMPEGHTPPYPTPLPSGKPSPATQPATSPNYGIAPFTADLMTDVIPLVESSYKVKTDAAHRAVAGLSMGGGQSLHLSMTYPDRFAYVVMMSAGMRGMDDLNNTFPQAAGQFKKGSPFKLFWIGCGKKDRLLPPNVKVDQWLTELGVPHEFHQSEGSHDWRVWRRNLVETSQMLFAE